MFGGFMFGRVQILDGFIKASTSQRQSLRKCERVVLFPTLRVIETTEPVI
jgi:hypothetical protein